MRRGGKRAGLPRAQVQPAASSLEQLLDEPHLLSGWLSVNRDCYTMIDGVISWNENPFELLADTYHFLDMDFQPGQPAAHMIWDHDHELLQAAVDFYAELNNRTAGGGLDRTAQPAGAEASAADRLRRGALGRQVRRRPRGLPVRLDILGRAAGHGRGSTGFFELRVNDDLTIHIPERLTDPDLQERMAKVLVPPPVAKSDEILAESGGMFYSRETPEHERYVGGGRPLRGRRPAVHRRSDEDVQQGLRALCRHHRQGAGGWETASSSARASRCSRSPRTR